MRSCACSARPHRGRRTRHARERRRLAAWPARYRSSPEARLAASAGAGLAPRRARRVAAVIADFVVLEIAGQLGGVLVLEQPLEAPPRRVAGLLAAALGEVEVLVDLVQVDVTVA